jgi:hypothetical protein
MKSYSPYELTKDIARAMTKGKPLPEKTKVKSVFPQLNPREPIKKERRLQQYVQ